MIDVKLDFQERCDEITLYFSFVEKVSKRGSKISLSSGATEKVDIKLSKTLKANGFLLLYNLVESSVTKAIEQIYVKMRNEGTKFDDIKVGIKKEIIQHLKTHKNPTKFVDVVNSIAEDIIEECFSSEKLFSGNVDAKKIRDVSQEYGFSVATTYRKTKSGRELLTVKNRRNDLAHGILSFQEVGQEFTIQDMQRIKKEVVAYLSQILDNIEIYINNKDYLNRP